jgi:hypothetical protein
VCVFAKEIKIKTTSNAYHKSAVDLLQLNFNLCSETCAYIDLANTHADSRFILVLAPNSTGIFVEEKGAQRK